jgi:hypothetical protein
LIKFSDINHGKQKLQIINILEGISALECLMQDIVSEESIQHSEKLLANWFDGRKDMLGSKNEYTPKSHEMMHFPDQVRLHGPLQASSCFGGENVLQNIKNMVTCKVPKVILKQITERSSYLMEALKWRNENKNGKFQKLIQSIEKKYNENPTEISLPEEVLRKVYCENISNIYNRMGPKSLEIDGYLFIASGVTTKRKNNSICYYKEENIIKVGLIEFFIEVETFVAQVRLLAVKCINEKLKGSDLLQNDQTLPLYYVLEQSGATSESVIIKDCSNHPCL